MALERRIYVSGNNVTRDEFDRLADFYVDAFYSGQMLDRCAVRSVVIQCEADTWQPIDIAVELCTTE